ncbi:hypothetical protein pmac_cds_13 [Pandoravirus macleodensis]|uniref:Uncharacterized protein n=1 Tax=Pandoravirus macleodensis TaxID=2107707 RepID=A0A2U7UE07_9VIRU|nr:hypothetical protein pmac_cds_13 [Pandoravirus macleodensis]AVK76701.1 hypothetical protein pmac_cds_13 [Pandoravirus macleodensis]
METDAMAMSPTMAATGMSLVASAGKLAHSALIAASTPIALCGIAAAASACMRARRRDGDGGVMRALGATSRAACAVVGFGAAMLVCRDRSTSMVTCAAASIVLEETIAMLLAHGPRGMLGCLVAIVARVSTSVTAAAALWCVWNLCFVGPASIISSPLLALRASHGTLVWAVMIAPAVYPFVAMCYRGLRATTES